MAPLTAFQRTTSFLPFLCFDTRKFTFGNVFLFDTLAVTLLLPDVIDGITVDCFVGGLVSVTVGAMVGFKVGITVGTTVGLTVCFLCIVAHMSEKGKPFWKTFWHFFFSGLYTGNRAM